MSINLKRKSKLYKVLDESNLVDLLVFGFLIDHYQTLILLNKTIHGILAGKMEKYVDKVINRFLKVYSPHLKVQKQTYKPKLRPYRSSKSELKIDFPMYFRAKSSLKEEETYSLSYCYEVKKRDKVKKYLWKTEFFISSPRPRTLWMYKEYELDNDQIPLYTTDTLPTHSSDRLCLLVPFYNFAKIIEPSAITFFPLKIEKLESRDCPIEKLYYWGNYDYYNNPIDFELQDLIRGFPEKLQCESIKKSSYNNNFRVEFQLISQFRENIFNYEIACQKQTADLTIELKKKGFYDEKCKKIAARVGDRLIIYLMKK